MTIDPMAAVTTATDSVARSAATADPAASADATVSPQNATQPSAADQSNKVDLLDYTAKQQHTPPAIDTLVPESKAKYLANPAELGGKVLEKMESFHQRSVDFHNDFQNGSWRQPQPMAAAGGGDVMGGPAQQHVAGTAGQAPDMLDGLRRVMDYAIETTMVTTSSSQFTKTINTLMKGQ
ncbi:MAG: hypothetical protein ACR2RA_19940 [Geminicoccaceae bacterium]